MMLASLTADLARAQAEFARLHSFRGMNGSYARRSAEVERLIGLHADRIARLHKFASMLRAKELNCTDPNP